MFVTSVQGKRLQGGIYEWLRCDYVKHHSQGWIMNTEIRRNIRPKVSHNSTQGSSQKGVQPSYGYPWKKMEEIQGKCT